MDPLATDTSEFWKTHGEFNDVDPGKIQTEVFRLPTTCFAEDQRQLHQLRPRHPVALEGRRTARAKRRTTPEIMADLFLKPEGDVRQGRRRLSRPDPEPDLGLSASRPSPRPKS